MPTGSLRGRSGRNPVLLCGALQCWPLLSCGVHTGYPRPLCHQRGTLLPRGGWVTFACALFADARHACRSVHFCIVLRDWLRLCVRVFCRARRPQWPCLWGTTRDLRVATAVPPTKPRRSCVVQAPTAVRACGLTVQVAPTATFRCCHQLPARACVQRATSVTRGRPLPPKIHAALRRGECVWG